jgi:hypothetical protein
MSLVLIPCQLSRCSPPPLSSQLCQLRFQTKQGAIDFAERNGKESLSPPPLTLALITLSGWKYEVNGPVPADVREPGWRGYKHNFLPHAVANLPKPQKQKWFHASGSGASHFVMPLKYHGDGIVSQHGGD